ncbi:MAG: AAA family ATPase [Pseudomonadales bacterium]|nr:AAA family ATPase [Pseudomonadales bacterium]
MANFSVFDDRVPELITTNGNLSLATPYIEQQTLSDALKTQPALPIKTALKLGISLCECLEQLHQNNWIHKGITPNNILYSAKDGSASLADDLSVISAGQLGQLVAETSYCEESLAYQSPEQCGRVRLDIDRRSDLYALGCVLYRCIVGHSPFLVPSAQPVSTQNLIHSHLAEIPQTLESLSAECPRYVSQIVSILLHKETEKRYQTAQGLKHDLLIALQRLDSQDNSDFVLQRKDITDEIVLPSILLGRNEETQRLLTLYQHVCGGVLGVAYVTGLSGIGKSRLVQELEAPILLRQGLFTSGKYNQFSKHQPYATISQAIGKLIRFILTETEDRLQAWKQNI